MVVQSPWSEWSVPVRSRVVTRVLDAVIFGLLVLILVGEDTAQLFKVVFFLLTVAALIWDGQHFAMRAVVWTVLTATAVVVAIVDGRAPVLELIDVAYIVVVLALVYGVTSRRSEQAETIGRMLDRRESEVAELTDLAELKADFTAMVAHEFGNPLAALRRLNDMMSIDDLDAATRSELIAASRTELDTLRVLVADVTASVEMERGGFPVAMEPVGLAGVVDAASTFGGSVSGDHEFEVDVDAQLDHAWVIADAGRLGQVLRNLVSNAVKYSGAGSTVRLRVSRPTDETVRFEVIDGVRGISDADLARVFGKYDRAAAPADVPGVGLGLYISRQLVEAHGSELMVESVSGVGSVFAFDLGLQLSCGSV